MSTDYQDIKSYTQQAAAPAGEAMRRRGLSLDLDRFRAVVRVVVTLWIAFFLWVYVDPPGHSAYVMMAGIFALIIAMVPQASALLLFLSWGGGIAFDTPANMEPGKPAVENDVFDLYKNRASISEKTYARKTRWLLHFDSGVRGLKSGAPVELQGIQIGQVLDVNLEFDVDKEAFNIPVLVEIEPDRIQAIGDFPESAERKKTMDYLVAKGLRAQLKTGSLITGQLLVAIDMHPEASSAKINWKGRYPQFPTMPTAMEEMTTSLTQLLNKFEKLPIEQIGNDLRDTVAGTKQLINSADLQKSITALNQTLNQAQKFVAALNTGIAPELKIAVSNLNSALIQAQKLTESLNSSVAPQADRTLRELQAAARSIKVWAEYLERHPEALIRGKGRSKRR